MAVSPNNHSIVCLRESASEQKGSLAAQRVWAESHAQECFTDLRRGIYLRRSRSEQPLCLAAQPAGLANRKQGESRS